MNISCGIHSIMRRSMRNNRCLPILRGDAGHHVAPPPPFVCLPPPSRRLPEEIDVVWNDYVAPELCLDFEAPHISSLKALKHLLTAFSIFPIVMGFVYLSDPENRRAAAPRGTTLPDLSWELGWSNAPKAELDAVNDN